jgi:hypothetical protein
MRKSILNVRVSVRTEDFQILLAATLLSYIKPKASMNAIATLLTEIPFALNKCRFDY